MVSLSNSADSTMVNTQDQSHMQGFGHGCQMARKVAFGALGYSLSAPSDKDGFLESGIGVFHFDERKLYFPIGEVLN